MAKQHGIDPKVGTIGGITYYKSGGEYLMKRKSGVSKERLNSDPSFKRTREQMAEFAKAGQAGKLLRDTLAGMTKNVADDRMISRLVRSMLKVIKADATNFRGQRNVIDGEIELLKGFNFNSKSNLKTVLLQPFTTTIDRPTGKLAITIPTFKTEKFITAPKEATHFKVVAAAAEIDFEKGMHLLQSSETADFPLSQTDIPDTTLQFTLTANSTHPLFLVMGLEFSLSEHDKLYVLSNGAFNALELVDISGQ